jgi:hypothetical protein
VNDAARSETRVEEPAPSSGGAAGPAGSSRVADVVLIAVCAIGIAFLLLQLLTFGYGRDQGIYAMVGRAILAGKMPYRDAWDFKPPGVFVVYALSRAVLGGGQAGIRVVEAAGLVGTLCAMVRIAERWWGDRRIGWIAGVITVLVHAQLDFWHTAQPESFGGMLTIFALLAMGPLLTEGVFATRPATRRLLAAGALLGAAGLLKPPLAGAGAVIAAALSLRALREHRLAHPVHDGGSPGKPGSAPKPPGASPLAPASLRAALRPVVPIVAGGAAPIALCALWFAAKGALREMYDVLFVFTPHYTKLSWVGENLPGMTYWGFTEWLCTYCSVATVGVLLALGFPRAPRERPGFALIAAIIAVHIVGVIMQGKFFPYHYGATWPLTALLAGLGYVRLWAPLARRGLPGALVFFAGFAFVAFFRTATKDVEGSFLLRCRQRIAIFTTSPRDVLAMDRLASVADVNAAANRAVAAFLRERVPADRAVFVWGFEPVIYDLADRTPATRYLYDVPQRVAWAKEKERAALMRDLAASRPAAIVVEHRDVFPMVTGDAIDSADTLKGFWELRELIASRYWLASTIEDFDVYLEK